MGKDLYYIPQFSGKGRAQVKKDEKTYEEVWNNSASKCCENCGIFLGEDFRDWEGRVNDKRLYSHILTKAAYPEMRNDVRNFNLLCPFCHSRWETGGDKVRKQMNIYEKNMKTIEMLKKEYYGG